MSNAENLASCMDAILAIPTDQVLEPNIPVDVFVQEAENLVHWSKEDLPQLSQAKVNAAKIEELNTRAGACREAQSLWVKDRRSVKDAQRQWNEESPAAYDLRDELLHTYRSPSARMKNYWDGWPRLPMAREMLIWFRT